MIVFTELGWSNGSEEAGLEYLRLSGCCSEVG